MSGSVSSNYDAVCLLLPNSMNASLILTGYDFDTECPQIYCSFQKQQKHGELAINVAQEEISGVNKLKKEVIDSLLADYYIILQ